MHVNRDHKEGWELKNWCFLIVVLEKTLESILDCKEIKPINPKGNQPLIFIGRTDAEAPILWSPDAKSRLTGKDWRQGRLTAGGEGDNRGWDGWMSSLARWTWVWASSRRWWRTGKPEVLHKESDMTKLLNNSNKHTNSIPNEETESQLGQESWPRDYGQLVPELGFLLKHTIFKNLVFFFQS